MAINDVPDSGVADNEAFGNMFGRRYGRNNSWRQNVGFGGGRGGRNSGIVVNGNSFASERQLTNYMKNVDAMKDADNQRGQDTARHNKELEDWGAERSIDQGTRYGAANPHATNADLINKKFSWNPGFAPTPKPTAVGDTPKPQARRNPKATRAEVADAVTKGFISPEEANDDGDGKPLNAAYSRAYAKSASSSPSKAARGRQFTGPQKGGTPAGSPAVNYDSAPKPPTPPPPGGGSGRGSRKSGNELNEITGPKNAAGNGRTDLPTKFF